MARGSVAKEEIWAKIKRTFPGAFECNGGKEFRIPWTEGGDRVEIKIAMTCAKENVGGADQGMFVEQEPVVEEKIEYKVPESQEEHNSLAELMRRTGILC